MARVTKMCTIHYPSSSEEPSVSKEMGRPQGKVFGGTFGFARFYRVFVYSAGVESSF